MLVILIILYTGLNRNDRIKGNAFSWNQNDSITFEKGAIAYTEPFITPTLAEQLNDNEFQIEIELELPEPIPKGQHILTIPSADNNKTALTLWQWKNTFIAMNGDDYDHSRRLPRITTSLDSNRHTIKLKSSKGNTEIFVDGKHIRSFEKFKLNIPTQSPAKDEGSRIILGNSMTRENSWQGTLHRLTIYATDPLEENGATKPTTLIEYQFDEQEGRTVYDHSSFENHLYLPTTPPILGRSFLVSELDITRISYESAFDVILNFCGFVPLGLVMMAFLRSIKKPLLISFLLTIVSAFAISLFIEYSQSWMIERSSSLRDLILNASGAFLGILLYSLFTKLLGLFNKHVDGLNNQT